MGSRDGQTARPGRAAFGCAALAGFLLNASQATAESAAFSSADLDQMAIEDLANIEISSVSKTNEPLSNAPAAVYVITEEQIVRSGAQSLPEILRLAPNLQVVRTSANHYFVTARGLNGNPGAQNFSNKLLVLIDGRSVYTPLYSGVQWDVQDVFPLDIERIEVISGPGATLWGANAVNGVINVITKTSSDTQGLAVDAAGGNQQTALGVRYGGRAGASVDWRVYGRDLRAANTDTPAGLEARDGSRQLQGGFRLDWTPDPDDLITLQGDVYDGWAKRPGRGRENVAGHNLLGRWSRTWADGSALRVQGYYDRTERTTAGTGVHLSIYDLDVQYNRALGQRHRLVLGGGYRVQPYRIRGAPVLFFSPSGRTLKLANAFVQDTIALGENAKLTLGLKLEDDPYVGIAWLPNARLSWKAGDTTLLWASASRAIRSPTPFDRDVREVLGGTLFVVGGADFRSEKLTAYEAGVRMQPTATTSLSISGFYNVYDDLRSLEYHPRLVLPLHFSNQMRGQTYGVEIWGEYRVTPWWRLSASYNDLIKQLRFARGSSGLLGVAQAGNDPRYRAFLRSSMNLGPAVTLDAGLRYMGALPDPKTPAYTELDASLGWQVADQVRLSVSGSNLLHKRHQEFPVGQGAAIPRSVLAGLQWRF